MTDTGSYWQLLRASAGLSWHWFFQKSQKVSHEFFFFLRVGKTSQEKKKDEGMGREGWQNPAMGVALCLFPGVEPVDRVTLSL